MKVPTLAASLIHCWMWFNVSAIAQTGQPSADTPMPRYDDAGRKLPPGVPREVDTNGTVVYVNHHFTTPAYQEAALNMVLEEANQIAKALELPENLPITATNIVEYHIPPFGFAYAYKMAGNIAT